jgi:hypothetical protein
MNFFVDFRFIFERKRVRYLFFLIDWYRKHFFNIKIKSFRLENPTVHVSCVSFWLCILVVYDWLTSKMEEIGNKLLPTTSVKNIFLILFKKPSEI